MSDQTSPSFEGTPWPKPTPKGNDTALGATAAGLASKHGEMIEGIAGQVIEGIKTLHRYLDDLEKEVLSSASRAKGAIDAHLEVASKAAGKAVEVSELIRSLREKVKDNDGAKP